MRTVPIVVTTVVASASAATASARLTQAERNAPAEVYDPATGQFPVTGSLTTARASHDSDDISAPRFDPVTKAYTGAGSMAIARLGHSAIKLADGTVLMIGGNVNDGLIEQARLGEPRVCPTLDVR